MLPGCCPDRPVVFGFCWRAANWRSVTCFLVLQGFWVTWAKHDLRWCSKCPSTQLWHQLCFYKQGCFVLLNWRRCFNKCFSVLPNLCKGVDNNNISTSLWIIRGSKTIRGRTTISLQSIFAGIPLMTQFLFFFFNACSGKIGWKMFCCGSNNGEENQWFFLPGRKSQRKITLLGLTLQSHLWF